MEEGGAILYWEIYRRSWRGATGRHWLGARVLDSGVDSCFGQKNFVVVSSKFCRKIPLNQKEVFQFKVLGYFDSQHVASSLCCMCTNLSSLCSRDWMWQLIKSRAFQVNFTPRRNAQRYTIDHMILSDNKFHISFFYMIAKYRNIWDIFRKYCVRNITWANWYCYRKNQIERYPQATSRGKIERKKHIAFF